MKADTAFAGTKRLRAHSRRSALLGAALCLAGSIPAGAAWAQQQAPQKYFRPYDLYKNCPPGHRIEFVIGSATVYVDPQWLSMEPPVTEFPTTITGCPTTPLKVPELFLSMPKGLGLQSDIRAYRLTLEAAYRDAKPPENASGPTVPWVENRGTPNPAQSPDVRSYRLHYPGGGEGLDPTVDIWCFSVDKRRLCEDTPYIYQGVSVRYSTTQPDLPAPSETQSASPATEPGALLQFDERLREWITSIKRKS